jgi:hypothetical protein
MTASKVLTGTDAGCAFTNTNATASITFTLPKAAVGLTAVTSGLMFQFLVASAHNIVITPKTGDTIRGLAASASLTLTTVGQFVQLECIVANFWEVVSGNVFTDGITVSSGSTSVTAPFTVTTTGGNVVLAANNDGSATLGYNGTTASLSIATTGAVTIAAPSSGTALTVAGTTTITGAGGLQTTKFAMNGQSPVATTSGFGTPTGNAQITNFPGATATLVQCSESIAEILIVLKNFGFIAA